MHPEMIVLMCLGYDSMMFTKFWNIVQSPLLLDFQEIYEISLSELDLGAEYYPLQECGLLIQKVIHSWEVFP